MKITRDQIVERFYSESKNMSTDSKKNLLRELLQEAILCHMEEVELFNEMAFHGGTSLRLLHRTERFSEDLDMSLMLANENYDAVSAVALLEKSMIQSHIDLEFQNKCKPENPIKKFFINDTELLEQLSRDIGHVIVGEKIKIKFELDILPSDYQVFVDDQIKSPFSATVNAHDLATCMGQKIHAVLCRGYFYGMDIIKGRDLYDLEWYFQKNINPNLNNLKECLFRGGPWKDQVLVVDNKWITKAFHKSLQTKNFESILEDLKPLIDANHYAAVSSRWNKKYFNQLLSEKLHDIFALG
jgi:predicted nucleotidyltransferase component of viral defense system